MNDRGMQRLFWRISQWAFVALVMLAVIGVGATLFVPTFTPERVGCYWTDALIPYVACPKVPAGRFIAFVLNLPFRVFFYAGMFGFYFLTSGELIRAPGRVLLSLLECALYLAPLVIGGLYPIRWLYLRARGLS